MNGFQVVGVTWWWPDKVEQRGRDKVQESMKNPRVLNDNGTNVYDFSYLSQYVWRLREASNANVYTLKYHETIYFPIQTPSDGKFSCFDFEIYKITKGVESQICARVST